MGSLKCSLNGRLFTTVAAARRRVVDRQTVETGAAISVLDGLERVVVGCGLGTIVAVESWTSGVVVVDVVVPAQCSWVVMISESDAGTVIVVAVALELSRDKNETQQPWRKKKQKNNVSTTLS